MKRFLVAVLLVVLVGSGPAASAFARPPVPKGSPLIGDFAYESASDGPDGILIDASVNKQTSGKFALGMTAGHPDAHGAAPDGGGEGKIGADGVLRFAFEDSFFNRGTGTFRRVGPGRYRLDIDITEVHDPRCLPYYGAHILKRRPQRK